MTKKIAEVEIDLEAISKLDQSGRESVFAHLKGKEKRAAVAELEEALAPAADTKSTGNSEPPATVKPVIKAALTADNK